MTLRKFFVGRTIVFVILLVIGFGVYIYKTHYASVGHETVTEVLQTEDVAPKFTWSFAKDSSLNLDGIPQTNVFLEARYADGSAQKKLIDTVPGGCSVLPDSDERSIPNTDTIQCYYAGLGYIFIVTKGTNGYLVERKTFEEVSPENQSPEPEYEVVSRF